MMPSASLTLGFVKNLPVASHTASIDSDTVPFFLLTHLNHQKCSNEGSLGVRSVSWSHHISFGSRSCLSTVLSATISFLLFTTP